MPFTLGPPDEAPDDLSEREMSCLIRAARHRIQQLNDLAESSYMLGNKATTEVALEELNCLQTAVSWLWRKHRLR